MRRWLCLAVVGIVALALSWRWPVQAGEFVQKGSRAESMTATLASFGLPTFTGTWHLIGPFECREFASSQPLEKKPDLQRTYIGKNSQELRWQVYKDFQPGKTLDLMKAFKGGGDHVCAYLLHEFTVKEAVKMPLSLGSDDGLRVWLDGKLILEDDAARPAAPDQAWATLDLQPGTHQLLIRVNNQGGGWEVYVQPELPTNVPPVVQNAFYRTYPKGKPTLSTNTAEANHYRIVTIPVPENIVLEVGGLGFRPDGKLLACTRRGDVWLISGLDSADTASVKFTRFAGGLHEALGLHVDDNNTVYVVQRPELTKLVDRDGDGVADEFVTVCDKWGVSGDYHEFAFGPARGKDGNFYITLNVGFGGGHQAKCPWRGWCMKITPPGEMTPVATGLRSPNGVNFSPDGDLFYADNQGEWVATNKLHHIQPGEFYGHQAGLKWLKDSPFKNTLSEKVPSGMLYDGQSVKGGPSGLPKLTPPVIWFPYGKMGQSTTEPRWDTTAGKFGPFTGQMLLGDQTKSMIMRVALEKVNGRFQGACFPFRSGFQCGINRLAFAPDGSLFAGQTNRGWGSVGGKPHGLQRLIYTGVLPFEILTMKLTKDGFDLTFTKPLDPAKAEVVAAYALQSYTYNYWGTYGSPEVDRKAEKVDGVTLSADGLRASLRVGNLKRGRVYELTLTGVQATDGTPLLHPEAWYTLNELP
jgi:hypothetical protein